MIENQDYELIPNEEDSWNIRIITGEYIETVFSFQTLKFDSKKEELTFSVEIVYTPDPDLTTDDVEFQRCAGDILYSIFNNISSELEGS